MIIDLLFFKFLVFQLTDKNMKIINAIAKMVKKVRALPIFSYFCASFLRLWKSAANTALRKLKANGTNTGWTRTTSIPLPMNANPIPS